jgi:hypothetical protein
MSSWRNIRDAERKLAVLTRDSMVRWDIIISILHLIAERLKRREEDVVFSRDLVTVHKPGNVYNVIDILNRLAITKALSRDHPRDAFRLNIPNGVTILSKEIETWDEISHIRPLTELQTHALKVIRQLLQEIQTLKKGSPCI